MDFKIIDAESALKAGLYLHKDMLSNFEYSTLSPYNFISFEVILPGTFPATTNLSIFFTGTIPAIELVLNISSAFIISR